MKKILVLGSINIDQVIMVNKLPKIGETIKASMIDYHSGGKGANQAVALAKMGCDVTLLSMIGNDEYGRRCLESCNKNKVNIKNVAISSKNSTGLASIYVQNNGINSIVILPGANSEINSDFILKNKVIIENCDIFVTQLETDVEGVFLALEIAKKTNKITVLNPAPAFELEKSHLINCDYIIPNETELATITNTKITNQKDILKACQKLNELSPSTKVIVTFGKDGVFYFDNKQNKLLHFKALATNVVDTTAAGDSFIGGLVFYLSLNKTLEEAIGSGLKVAAITVSRKGAQESIPTIEEINNA